MAKSFPFLVLVLGTAESPIPEDSAGGAEGIKVCSLLSFSSEVVSIVATVDDICAAIPIPPVPKRDVAKNEIGEVVTGTSQ